MRPAHELVEGAAYLFARDDAVAFAMQILLHEVFAEACALNDVIVERER